MNLEGTVYNKKTPGSSQQLLYTTHHAVVWFIRGVFYFHKFSTDVVEIIRQQYLQEPKSHGNMFHLNYHN